MLSGYVSVISICLASIVIATPEYQNSYAERMRVLGPLAPNQPLRGVIYNCAASTPSSPTPISVHALRPADIKHVGAVGDSLTAANGAKAYSIIALLVEYRGVSWCIGGDANLDSVTTLPNILKKSNPSLYGYSTGNGNQNSKGAVFNVAKPGAVSRDMLGQAVMLVDKMKKELGANNYATQWKLITFFIGGNDCCAVCKDENEYSVTKYVSNVKAALDYLKANMPRALVNFVTVLNVAELEDLHEGVTCQSMQNLLCDCAVNKATRELVRKVNLAYQKATNELIQSGIYDTADDFTVVCQPFMEHMTVPVKPDGKPDFSYFAPDCFHFSQKGHEAAAVELWNNMMEPVGKKNYCLEFS